jgi:hypothetical protein
MHLPAPRFAFLSRLSFPKGTTNETTQSVMGLVAESFRVKRLDLKVKPGESLVTRFG